VRIPTTSRHALLALSAALSFGITCSNAASGAEQSTLAAVPASEREALSGSVDAGTSRSFALLEELVNRNSGTFNAAGPGVHDMKGGLVVMIEALRALHGAVAKHRPCCRRRSTPASGRQHAS
jgi:hypothetical protein